MYIEKVFNVWAKLKFLANFFFISVSLYVTQVLQQWFRPTSVICMLEFYVCRSKGHVICSALWAVVNIFTGISGCWHHKATYTVLWRHVNIMAALMKEIHGQAGPCPEGSVLRKKKSWNWQNRSIGAPFLDQELNACIFFHFSCSFSVLSDDHIFPSCLICSGFLFVCTSLLLAVYQYCYWISNNIIALCLLFWNKQKRLIMRTGQTLLRNE